jgi:hypothetical protein
MILAGFIYRSNKKPVTMKTILAVLLSAAMILSTSMTNAQGLKSIDDKNGFKTYKLGSKYTSVNGTKFKDESGAEKVIINRTDEMIGEIPVKSIELFYLRDTLSRIEVKVSPENHARLIEACKGSFGTPTNDFCDNEATRTKKNENLTTGKYYHDQYKWKASKITLDYYYQYPIVSGDPYAVKDLYIAYSLNNYATRLQNAKKGAYSPKDF